MTLSGHGHRSWLYVNGLHSCYGSSRLCELRCKEISISSGVNNDFSIFHQCHRCKVVIVCNSGLSGLTKRDQIRITLQSQDYVLQLDFSIICKRDGQGSDFFYLNDLSYRRYKVDAFSLCIGKQTSIVIEVVRSI